jgi:L-aspartate oxidase
MIPERTDYLVIGSGIAGLTFALKASELGEVVIVTKKERTESSTNYAQGGIASVLDRADSFDAHVEDTIRAGGGLCKRAAVETMVREGPARVRELLDLGVPFERKNGALDLGREGGHRADRIVHCRDRTGLEIEHALIEAARSRPGVTLLENHLAVDLLQDDRPAEPAGADGPGGVDGAYVMLPGNGEVVPVTARRTVLASGGAGKVYLYTSNPDIATGDGLAMAYRAGARLANLEFVQFHPTCLYHPEAKTFLLSEALRGAGAVLRNRAGRAIMEGVHPMKDLAPRDIVARTIDAELKATGEKCVYLDLTHLSPSFVRERFPTITRRCAEFGFDLTRAPVPTVPAAHYLCGGVVTDLEGRTTLPRLYALGEVSHTGVHGGNRLASNSLLEALVFSHRAAKAERREWKGRGEEAPPGGAAWEEGPVFPRLDPVVLDHDWDTLRRIMWDYVGIVRRRDRLQTALDRVRQIRATVERTYRECPASHDLVELRNISLLGELIVRSALARRESRGLHYLEDYPETDPSLEGRDTILRRGEDARLEGVPG